MNKHERTTAVEPRLSFIIPHSSFLVVFLALLTVLLSKPTHCETTQPVVADSERKGHGPNIALPVRADPIAWEDIVSTSGYRLQRHRSLGYFRLLDAANVRLGWGSRQYCEDLLARELKNPSETRSRFNIEFPTLGGLHYWGDEMIYCGWRIQRNALYGYYRLLDPRNARRAWGTYAECEKALRSLVDTNQVRPRSDECVILLHGFFRTRNSFKALEKHLAAQGYEVVAIEYPSTHTSIEREAAQLARVLERLQGARKIHFVTHSLGSLITRCYLRDHRDPRIGRMVMLAPPNRGAEMAKMLSQWSAYRALGGPAGLELIGSSGSLVASLPAPWCPFGVIAGGRGDGRGYSPLLKGDDDGILRVEETRLDGMQDFLLVPAVHTFIMNNKQVQDAVVQFLRTGRFTANP